MSDASLILATRNAKKLAELRRILEAGSVDVSVTDLSEYPDMPEVAETGATFTENALLKAMPGVLSARWAGRHGDDEANLRLVLGQLADVPADRRAAHFACVAALVLPSGGGDITEGTVSGRITDAPRGTNGFGYDPIFVPAGFELTTAEMTPEAKDAISHRGRALRALAPIIAALLGG